MSNELVENEYFKRLSTNLENNADVWWGHIESLTNPESHLKEMVREAKAIIRRSGHQKDLLLCLSLDLLKKRTLDIRYKGRKVAKVCRNEAGGLNWARLIEVEDDNHTMSNARGWEKFSVRELKDFFKTLEKLPKLNREAALQQALFKRFFRDYSG